MVFRIGQKVVCVDDENTPDRSWWPGCKPKKGEIYTIRGYSLSPLDNTTPGILLQELTNKIIHDAMLHIDACYRADRFRPLVEKKTDISTLVALLNPANHKQLEGVK